MLANPQLIDVGRFYPIQSRATAILTNIPAVISAVITNGYYVTGDGGGATYERVASEPAHAGKFQSNDGAWWELCSEVVSVKQFGAVGDDATNDAVAINNAFTFAAGKQVVIPPAIYLCGSTTINVPADTVVNGRGATLRFTSQITAVNSDENVEWTGGFIEGPGGSVYGTTGYGFYCSGTENPGLAPTYIKGPKVTALFISGFDYAGYYAKYVDGGYFTKGGATDCGYVGAAGISCLSHKIDYNTITSIKGTGAPDTYGAFFSALEGTEVENPRSEKCSISFNIIDDIPDWEGIDVHGDNYITIEGNIITNTRRGINVVPGDSDGVTDRGSQQVTVCNNIVEGIGTGSGIIVAGAATNHASNIVVAGNTLKNCGAANDIDGGAVILYYISNLTFTGNVIDAPYCIGANLINDITGLSMTGNSIRNPRDNTFTVPTCIQVRGNNVEGLIANNTLTYDDGTLGTYVGVRSITVSAGSTGLNLVFGTHQFIGLDATHLTLVLGTTTGIDYTNMMVQRGVATISLNSASSSAFVNVTCPRTFPAAIGNVQFSINGSSIPGPVDKQPILSSNTYTSTGFQLFARSVDLTNFGGSTGNLDVNWTASL